MRTHSLKNSIHIAVIGGNGFLGRSIITRLSAYPNVRIFSLDKLEHGVHIDTSKSKAIIQQITMDVSIGSNIQTWLAGNLVDIVIYAAGYENLPDGLWNTCSDDIKTVLGLTNTLHGIGSMGLDKNEDKPYFLYLSSWTVYGKHNFKQPLTEDSKEYPGNHAGMTKLLAEDIVKRLGTKYNLPWCIVRPTEVYGKRDRKELQFNKHWMGYIPFLVDKIVNKVPELKLLNNNSIDLVHVNYFSKIILNLIQNKIQGIYNISSGNTIPVQELANNILNIYGESSTKIITENLLNIESMTILSKKIQQEFPYEESKYNLDSFLKAYIPIRRYEIAENIAIEDVLSEPLSVDSTATGAKEYYDARNQRRRLSYSKIKDIAGDQFFKIKIGKLQDRTKELLDLPNTDSSILMGKEEQNKLEERQQLILTNEIEDKNKDLVLSNRKSRKKKNGKV